MRHFEIKVGDSFEVLRGMDSGSVQCVVTSPPYWRLRDYGVPGQLGLEATPEEFIARMVELFAEVRRVLREDGTLWLNLGDSYAGNGGAGGDYAEGGLREGQPKYQGTARQSFRRDKEPTLNDIKSGPGLKPKDLCGIPWRVALALQADGWWLRSDIIWSKPNPMPESVTDRPTKAHEYVFLLTKSGKYFYDADAIRGPLETIEKRVERIEYNGKSKETSTFLPPNPAGRNKRTVWTIPTQAFPEAHFATFPEKLVEPCVKAGTSEKGCCPECGAGRVRLVTIFGWRPSCTCNAGDPVPCTVLDPFSGSGTTGVVALRLGRSYIGIELNPEYAEMSHRRIDGDAPLLNISQ